MISLHHGLPNALLNGRRKCTIMAEYAMYVAAYNMAACNYMAAWNHMAAMNQVMINMAVFNGQICQLCNVWFVDANALERHTKASFVHRDFQCPNCYEVHLNVYRSASACSRFLYSGFMGLKS